MFVYILRLNITSVANVLYPITDSAHAISRLNSFSHSNGLGRVSLTFIAKIAHTVHFVYKQMNCVIVPMVQLLYKQLLSYKDF